jgi:uncharacterized membrane protein YcaP (DUF421 family)
VDIVIRSVVMYLLLLLVLRITTRRVMRSATPLDMVLIFVFGGVAVQAIVGGDHSVTSAVAGICAFAGTHLVVSYCKLRWAIIGRITEGPPVVLFKRGEWQLEKLHQMRMQEQDVLSELRQQGHRTMDEVELAVLEHNGGISIIPRH